MNKTQEIKTGTIVSYIQDGTFESKGNQFNRYKVTFANGEEWKFANLLDLPKYDGKFKKNIGDQVEFKILNAQYKNASFSVDELKQTNNFQSKSPNPLNGVKLDIILQVCYKENMQAFAKENRQSVIEYTKQDFISLIEILKNQ
tara:strand:+ start:51 stop:482 length:432 start_codon:yes stop_codon:yes gene_type:complete